MPFLISPKLFLHVNTNLDLASKSLETGKQNYSAISCNNVKQSLPALSLLREEFEGLRYDE